MQASTFIEGEAASEPWLSPTLCTRGAMLVELSCDQGYIRLQVSHTGEGISAEFLPHVFERFRQGDGSLGRLHGGLGLGLAISDHAAVG